MGKNLFFFQFLSEITKPFERKLDGNVPCKLLFVDYVFDCFHWTISVATTGTPTQTVRVATPGTTILKSAPGSIQQTIGGKQIITVHKAGGGSGTGHPQIVTLVKTNQGMQVATVSYAPIF